MGAPPAHAFSDAPSATKAESTASGDRAPTEARSSAHPGSLPGGADAGQTPGQRLGRAHQQHVGLADQPQCPIGEHGEKRRHDRAQIGFADVVGMRPLAQHAARRQPRLRDLEELACEERGDAGHPRVGWLRHDDVVALVGQQEVRAAVARPRAGSADPRAADGSRGRRSVRPRPPRGRSPAPPRASSPWVSAEPSVTPLPRPRIAARCGDGCSSSGTCASRRCVSMSAASDASTLPSMDREVVPVSRRTATVAVEPSR